MCIRDSPLAHDFAHLELHGGAFGDFEFATGDIRVAADSGLGQLDLEDAEIPELDDVVSRKGVCDEVEGFLNDLIDLMLDHAGLVGDFHDQIAFRERCHFSKLSQVGPRASAFLKEISEIFFGRIGFGGDFAGGLEMGLRNFT